MRDNASHWLRRGAQGAPDVRAGILALCLIMVGLPSCKGCRPRHDVNERPALSDVVEVRAAGALVGDVRVALDASSIAALSKSVLATSGVFAPPPSKAGTVQASLTLDVLGEGSSKEPEIGIKVHLKIEVHPAAPATARYTEDTAAIGQVPLDKASSGDVGVAFQRLAERTTKDLLLAYVARQKLWSSDEDEIAKTLASEDSDLRLEAIRIAGVRKIRRVLPAILRLLTDDDEATRDAALGAVVGMGERSAVKALADSRQMRDSYEMGKVLDAVASLGGQEARDYLSFVAETHDDPDIRAMAKEALDRLKKREINRAPTR